MDSGKGNLVVVQFGNGETHRFKPQSQQKLKKLANLVSFEKDERVCHPQHGEGVVHNVRPMQDGFGMLVIVDFDNGEQHRYKPLSQQKLQKIAREEDQGADEAEVHPAAKAKAKIKKSDGGETEAT